MNTRSLIRSELLPVILLPWLMSAHVLLAQRSQDNWYLEQTWTKNMGVTNGGLLVPYGVAIGPDQLIYVGDEGAGQVNVYQADGRFSFAISNGFGGGQSFVSPRGMILDSQGKLYVADRGQDCVFVFDKSGAFLNKVGGTNGPGDGQLSGVMDVAVSHRGEIYVLEYENCRVSVFSPEGSFLRKWGENGMLDGQLFHPTSIAVTPDERVLICQPNGEVRSGDAPLKVFDKQGKLLTKLNLFFSTGGQPYHVIVFGPTSVRMDPSGLIHVFVSCQNVGYPGQDHLGTWAVLYPDLSFCSYVRFEIGSYPQHLHVWPCHAVGPDGSMLLCDQYRSQLLLYRYAMASQWSPPRNAYPMPTVVRKQQRPNSPLVDIGYVVTDADDTNVSTGLLIFTNAAATPALSNCLRHPTLVEGTVSNLGPGIKTKQEYRLTWNPGSDWGVNLGDYRVAILARDHRPGLLDIHYLNLPGGRGMPPLKISRSPLAGSDSMQVWWWLLATNDVGISLSSNRIYGATGAYAGKVLCEDATTSSAGRAYLCSMMRVREATAEEVQWARQAAMPAGTGPIQWPPGRAVGGRPMAVNEYGFDTGNWDTNTCYWVVPLN